MASRDSNAAKLTPSKSPRTRNASAAAAAAARTPPPHPNKTPHAKTPTPKKRSGGAAKADDDNEPPKPVVSRFELQFDPHDVIAIAHCNSVSQADSNLHFGPFNATVTRSSII